MCKGKCQNVCAAPKCGRAEPDADIAKMRSLLTEAEGWNPGVLLGPQAELLRPMLDELETFRRNARDAQSPHHAGQPSEVVVKRMKRPADDGPISGEAIERRMLAICGCQGRYDCDCVSVKSRARIELWTEYNTTGPGAARAA